MKKAKLITSGLLKGNANLYQINCDDYVIVSRANTSDRGDETMIFPCDKQGNVTDWGELYAGYGESHDTALNKWGAEIVK